MNRRERKELCQELRAKTEAFLTAYYDVFADDWQTHWQADENRIWQIINELENAGE